VNFNTFGLIQTFGIFQPHYEALLDSAPSTVAWIGSIHIFFVYFLGTFSGWLLDGGFYRPCLVTGSCLQIIGLLIAGFSHNWWLSFLFHGVFQGLGNGLMFVPTVTMIGIYFQDSSMKTTARSLAGCGGATGGMLFPTIARYTIKSLGISWTAWIMCTVVLFTSLLIQIFAQPKPLSSTATASTTKKSRIVEWRAFREQSYTLYVAAIFFTFGGIWIPYFYIRVYAANALHITSTQSFAVMLILNGSGIPGRIVPAFLADKVLGTVNTYILIILFTSATLLCWPLVASTTSLVIWAMVYGFCAGGATFLMQASVASLTKGQKETGVKSGMAFGVVAFASLLGGPVGGALIRVGEASRGEGRDGYLVMQVVTGSVVLMGCGMLIVARVLKTGWRVGVRV
jgi:MFS family permease